MKKKNSILVFILISTLVLDQVTKILVTNNLLLGESLKLIPSFFSLTYVRNTGAAWSILEGKMIFFYLVTAVALGLMVWYFRTLKEHQFMSKVGVVLMISGTLGNLIDRLMFQYVRDFLDFTILGYDFPVFNVADSLLCIGIGLWLLDELLIGFGAKTK